VKPSTTYIGLLRGINVGGRNRIAMTDLRTLVATMGCSDVQTYIQSGNLVFKAAGAPAAIEGQLEQAIERYLAIAIPVLVRAAADWTSYTAGNPFPDAVRSEPNLVTLALSKRPLKPGVASALQERATNCERVVQVADALWIHFPQGIARSKLSPALLDRLAGSPVTARNWLTVLKLHEMSEPSAT
jgi:uncharacterized protein (DUF1697 family)